MINGNKYWFEIIYKMKEEENEEKKTNNK